MTSGLQVLDMGPECHTRVSRTTEGITDLQPRSIPGGGFRQSYTSPSYQVAQATQGLIVLLEQCLVLVREYLVLLVQHAEGLGLVADVLHVP